MKMDGYWVYTHTTPDGFVYVGRSGEKYNSVRWQPSLYRKTSLYPYIEKWGWDNIRHFFIDGLTKEESFELEDKLIRMYKDEGVCINKLYSGGLCCNGEMKDYREKNKEHIKECSKDYREKNKNKYNEYNKQYRENNKEYLNDYNKKYRAEHRDELNAKRRAKRAAKKQKPYTYGDPLF